jgi:cell division transport system ATP-binding protein
MIQFSNVTKTYGHDTTAISQVSFFIDKGEFVYLTGESGAGKTTVLKHIYMEELPTRGQVFACGYDSKYMKPRHIPALRRKLGIVFQDFRLLYDRDVMENVAFAIRATGARTRKIKKRVLEVLAYTGLSHKCAHFPQQLSGGEQQRVCIARAIVNTPWVLLADEPTGNLDIRVSLEIMELLQRINAWGTTVIMATHDHNMIRAYPYRQITLKSGSLVAGGNETVKPKMGIPL